MNSLTPYEKVQSSIKRGILTAIIEEYLTSDEERFVQFLNNVIGSNYYSNQFITDDELLKQLAEYNDINKMNEALE